MQGTWENGNFVLASTKDEKIARLSKDAERLDWLTEQMADTIYLDDGRIIDIGGCSKPHDVRFAIDTLMGANA